MIGGAVHLVNQTETAQDSAVKAGLGLRAVSFALFVKKTACRVMPPAGVPVASVNP